MVFPAAVERWYCCLHVLAPFPSPVFVDWAAPLLSLAFSASGGRSGNGRTLAVAG